MSELNCSDNSSTDVYRLTRLFLPAPPVDVFNIFQRLVGGFNPPKMRASLIKIQEKLNKSRYPVQKEPHEQNSTLEKEVILGVCRHYLCRHL